MAKKILIVNARRNDKMEFELSLKSEISFLSLARKDRNATFKIGGVDCFYAVKERISGVNGNFYADNLMEYNDFPNLNLLLAKGLKEGVVFNFGVFPISDDKIQNFCEQLKNQAKIIYLTYFKPIDITVTVTSSTVENESHD